MKTKGPEFAKWITPLVEALKQMGGSATPKEVIMSIAKSRAISKDILEVTLPSGAKRFNNQVQWARQYLAWEGVIDKSTRGHWKLTSYGLKAEINDPIALGIISKWIKKHRRRPQSK